MGEKGKLALGELIYKTLTEMGKLREQTQDACYQGSVVHPQKCENYAIRNNFLVERLDKILANNEPYDILEGMVLYFDKTKAEQINDAKGELVRRLREAQEKIIKDLEGRI